MIPIKILLTGSTGMLGREVLECLKKDKTFEVYTINRKSINSSNKEYISDLTDEFKVRKICEKIKPNVIVHCAALTDVSLCESQKDYAYLLHVKATQTLASCAVTSTFIYISTDSVYSGLEGMYDETSSTLPQNYYALTKLEGEKEIQKFCKNFYVLRTNIFGYHTPKSKSLFEWGIESLLNKQPISGFQNVFFNPIYTKNLATIIKEFLIKKPSFGIYNIGSNEYISKFDFLENMRSLIEIDSKYLTKTITLGEINGVLRPLNTTINVEKAKKSGISTYSCFLGQRQCINDYFKTYERNSI